MNDLDPCLAGCDSALGEAELLLALLAQGGTEEALLAPVRDSISRLHREVDRLRGLKVSPARRETAPFWIEMGGGESPWPRDALPGGDRP